MLRLQAAPLSIQLRHMDYSNKGFDQAQTCVEKGRWLQPGAPGSSVLWPSRSHTATPFRGDRVYVCGSAECAEALGLVLRHAGEAL